MQLGVFKSKSDHGLRLFRAPIMVGIVLFSLLVLGFVIVAIIVFKYHKSNILMAGLGFYALFFGCIPLMVTGATLLSFVNIPED
jgi:hypothetical protein